MPLTDAKIRTAKPTAKPIKLTDGNGLYLEVQPNGPKRWRYRYRIGSKENLFAIGDYPGVSLSDARAARSEARALVKQGIHPAHHRQASMLATHAANANTFEAVALEWIAKKKPHWTAYYLSQVERFIRTDAIPAIGALPMRAVTAAHVLAILKRIEDRDAATVAIMGRQWTSAIFRYAVATLRADTDPAAALKGAIQRPRIEHHKPLSRETIPALIKALESYKGQRTTVIAMRLMLLTFVRTVELRKATWAEVNFDRAEWRIPGERMKKREPHIIPLSRQAVALLRELRTYTGQSTLLFPNNRTPDTCMSGTTLNRALERLGFNGDTVIDFSAHGFRATASTFLNEMNFRPDVIERQLAHAPRNKVRASYNQAEYLEERRAMMQQWADVVDALLRKTHAQDTNAGIDLSTSALVA